MGFIIIFAITLMLYSSINTVLQPNMGRFNPERTKFIDQFGDNLLYRGNMPLVRVNVPVVHKKFALDEVIASMVLPSSMNAPVNPKVKAPSSLPKQYFFINFSLLTKFGRESAAYHIEEHFFNNNPAGKLIHYELHKLLFKGVISRDVGRIYDEVIVELRQQLISTNNSPRIIYLHCKAGLDRTGTVIAGYAMRYLGYSYEEAIAININQGLRRAPDFYGIMGIQDYARYLRDTIGIETIGKIPD